MSGLAKIQAPPLAQNVAQSAESKKTEDAKKVGEDFEAILVRQMLAQTNIGGKGGYADMATEALSTAITKGGGLGLGKIIEQQLTPHQANEKAVAALKVGFNLPFRSLKADDDANQRPISGHDRTSFIGETGHVHLEGGSDGSHERG